MENWAAATMVYDERRQQLVLFGGYDYNERWLDETWVFRGDRWQRLHTAHSPPPRVAAAASWDPLYGEILLFGGFGMGQNLNDLWELDGASLRWEPMTPLPAPSARYQSPMAFDRRRHVLVIAGGATLGLPYAETTDVWELAYRSAEEPEVCGSGGDDDRDGLADCADPDCRDDDACAPEAP